MKRPEKEAVTINGPAGSLEGLLEIPSTDRLRGAAVVCHPHPQHGGTMTNKVAHTIARAFLASDYATLRFNFRGVGASDGSFDEGAGEVDDVLASLDWMRARFPDGPLWLGGFSFGAAMSIRAAVTSAPAGLVSVAPAAFRFAGDLSAQPECPWLIVHGDEDELVPIEESLEWFNSLAPGPALKVFAETSHFFHGKLIELRDEIVAFVTDPSR